VVVDIHNYNNNDLAAVLVDIHDYNMKLFCPAVIGTKKALGVGEKVV
jgi:hypothetical protein